MWSYLKYELRVSWTNLKDTLKQLGPLRSIVVISLVILFVLWVLVTALAPVLPR